MDDPMTFLGVLCVLFPFVCTSLGQSTDVPIGELELGMMRYRFPPADLRPGAVGGLYQIHTVSFDLEQATSKLQEGEKLDENQYTAFKGRIDSILQSSNDPLVRSHALARQVILDWASQKIDGLMAAQQFETLSQADEGVGGAFNKGCAAVTYARMGKIDRAAAVFKSMDAVSTPQFGWFVFEMTKYYKEYTQYGFTQEDAKKGLPIPAEYKRLIEYADFLESTLFPMVSKYELAGKDYTVFERCQLIESLRNTAKCIRESLTGVIYLGISRRATDHLYPELLVLWENALGLIADAHGFEDPNVSRKQIAEYREKIIPRTKQLQEREQAWSEQRTKPALDRAIQAEVVAMGSSADVPSSSSPKGNTVRDSDADQGLNRQSQSTVAADQDKGERHIGRQRLSVYWIVAGGGLAATCAVIGLFLRKRVRRARD